MRRNASLCAGLLLSLAACGSHPDQPQPEAPRTARAEPAPAAAETRGSADRTPLAEPHGPIDPRSAEAAGQVVQSYGALIEQKRWAEANALWGNADAAAELQSDLAQYADLHLAIGNLTEPEGAAGSIYVTMPVVVYGDQADGQPFRRSAEIVLRRVNNVPGSTAAQRRWHIERVTWAE